MEAQNNPGSWLGLGDAIPTVYPPAPRDRMTEELHKTLSENHDLKADLKRGEEEYRGLLYAYREAEQDRSRLKDNNQSLHDELDNVRRELGEAKALAEIRGRELVGAQVFLTKADSLSISEVVDKVNILNEEIFQGAAILGETILQNKRDLSQLEMQRHYEQACRTIGEPMVELLNQAQRPDPQVNPLVAQVVLSTILVGFCVSKLDSWYPSDKDVSAFLGTLYSAIRISEEQAVSGRWRALTRSQMRPTSESWTQELIEKLRAVFIISAWAPLEDHRLVAFGQILVPIFKAVEDLRIALGEKFTSADLEVKAVRPNSQFEHQWMEEPYGNGSQMEGNRVKPEVVIGTVGIGLKKVLKERGFRGEEMFENILPAKVVLESTLRELLEPLQQTQALDGRG